MPIPHKVAQLVTQGALFVALVLALTINPRMRIRPNWFLGLFTLLAITSLMMSVRLVGLGTAYRSFRLIGFLFVLWLLTPWWGRRDLLVLRSQMRFLLLDSGLGRFRAAHFARKGARWPSERHALADPADTGCALRGGGRGPDDVALVLPPGVRPTCPHVGRARPRHVSCSPTHARRSRRWSSALLVAGTSLFLARRRVRKSLATALIVVVVMASSGVPVPRKLAQLEERTVSNFRASPVAPRPGRRCSRPIGQPPTFFSETASRTKPSPTRRTPRRTGCRSTAVGYRSIRIRASSERCWSAAILVLLLLTALCRARGPTRAMALFLIVYCIIAGISESGLGGASQYLLDLTVAASLLTFPSATGHGLDLQPGSTVANETVVSHQDATMRTPEHRKLKTPAQQRLAGRAPARQPGSRHPTGPGQRESSLPISRNHSSVVASPSSRLIGL